MQELVSGNSSVAEKGLPKREIGGQYIRNSCLFSPICCKNRSALYKFRIVFTQNLLRSLKTLKIPKLIFLKQDHNGHYLANGQIWTSGRVFNFLIC